MIKRPRRNDKKSWIMDRWFSWICSFDFGAFYPAPQVITGRSAVVKKYFTTYKQPLARAGFRRGQRR